MRKATIVLTDRYDQTADPFARSNNVVVDSTRYMSPVTDGKHIEMVDISGDLSEAEAALDADDHVIEYDITGESGAGIAYIQRHSSGVIGELLSILYGHDLVLDWPIRHELSGQEYESRFSVVGTNSSLQRAAESLPARVTMELQQIGRLNPEQSGVMGVLTSRQRELLEFAVDEGYYEVPRRTTHRTLASKLGLSAGTVSDRLQRIERRLVTSYLER